MVDRGETPLGGSHPGLADRLQAHVTGAKLIENAAGYPEMAYSLSAEPRLDTVKAHLLKLPLVHATTCSLEEFAVKGILPHTQKPEAIPGNTMPLDQSLGLDNYVFAYWGSIETAPMFGRDVHHVLIDPLLLAHEQTIVTPTDIAHVVNGIESLEEFDQRDQENLQTRYFDKMVQGMDWLDIITRRLFIHAFNRGNEPYHLTDLDALGEIKFHGTIEPQWILGVVEADERHAFWRKVLNQGFVPPPVYRALSRYPDHSYNVSPEDLGLPPDVGTSFWKNLLANASADLD